MSPQVGPYPAFNRNTVWRCLFVVVGASLAMAPADVQAQDRALGLDVSAWQGNWSQSKWNSIHNVDNQDFVFLRSSRGGTTGFYNQSDPNNNSGQNTLSQRYDDPYFVQNITRATNAGLYAGAYHFSRADVISSTQNSGGIANTGADEADHFIQMAGPWMRPGYLLPVHDFEAGDQVRTSNENAQFVLDFSNRMYEVMGIRPPVYVNGNYANFVLGGAAEPLRDEIVAKHPDLWIARWPNQNDPDSIPIQTGHPSDSISWVYGIWDDYGDAQPWSFWQYTSTGDLNSHNGNLDLNVAQGGIEFVKDRLVPALWMDNEDGQWTALGNWNSGQTPIAPVQGPGQANRVGSLTLPAVRLPTADDTVILDRPGADITVTLSSGSHNIRKLYVREALDITGGSLAVNYVSAPDSTPESARFSAPVLLGDAASLSVHTLWVDAQQGFTLDGQLTINRLDLARHSTSPATVQVIGNVAFQPLEDAAATIQSTLGTGQSGLVDLGGEPRVWSVVNGSAAIDLTVDVPVVNGSVIKSGPGTLQLTSATSYQGGVTVAEGKLILANLPIDDTADVLLMTGGLLELDFVGAPDIVNSLQLNGAPLPSGIWGGPGSGAQFTLPMLSGTGTLQVIAPLLEGDYNEDGVVNLADYAVWQDSLGRPPGTLPNDESGEAIGATQYQAWKSNFAATQGASLQTLSRAAVPEPSSLVVAGLILAFAGGAIRPHALRAAIGSR